MYTKAYLLFLSLMISACAGKETSSESDDEDVATSEIKKQRVIFDTDANNELDDQHALAYLLLNGDHFYVEAVTVNTTKSGGNIDEQYAEAERVMTLCNATHIPLLKGANGSFSEIRENLGQATFDGYEAVDFIIKEANEPSDEKLTVIAVGKVTNLALALEKDPTVAEKIRLVWLGSNYPEPGEYNQDNDTVAMNYVINTTVPFEMVTVRGGKPSGTDAVRVTQEEIGKTMPGLGPRASKPITGRHGGTFQTFGDYSINLFEHIDYHGVPPSRALFDMAAVAIVKDPEWAENTEIAAPILIDNQWKERPGSSRKITVWQNFNRDAIVADFYKTLNNYVLATTSPD